MSPSIVPHGLAHSPHLTLAGRKDEGCNLLGLFPLQPRGLPERRLPTVAEGDDSGGIEEVHISLATRVFHPDPRLGRVLPCHPWPTQAKSPSKPLQVHDTKAPQVCGAADGLPVDLAFRPRSFVTSGPEESTLDFVDALEYSGRRGEGGDVMNSLRTKFEVRRHIIYHCFAGGRTSHLGSFLTTRFSPSGASSA